MNRILITAGALTGLLVSGAAFAQTAPEVVVTTHKIVEKSVGRTSTGIPIIDVSLSYGVNVADLDPATHRGALDLEKRVRDAAMDACKELGNRYPGATPSDAECAKAATDKAMAKVHELEAGAAKK